MQIICGIGLLSRVAQSLKALKYVVRLLHSVPGLRSLGLESEPTINLICFLFQALFKPWVRYFCCAMLFSQLILLNLLRGWLRGASISASHVLCHSLARWSPLHTNSPLPPPLDSLTVHWLTNWQKRPNHQFSWYCLVTSNNALHMTLFQPCYRRIQLSRQTEWQRRYWHPIQAILIYHWSLIKLQGYD